MKSGASLKYSIKLLRCILLISAVLCILVSISMGGGILLLAIATVISTVAFYITISPESLLGFTMTSGEFGRILRKTLDGTQVFNGDDIRRAASRSGITWTTLIAIGLAPQVANGAQIDSQSIQAITLLLGIQSGVLFGWLSATFSD